MKKMRSRFRFITLVLACSFLLAIVICTVNVLKSTGVSIPDLSSLPNVFAPVSPEPEKAPDVSPVPEESPGDVPGPGSTPVPASVRPDDAVSPGTDILPNPEYNPFGL